MEIYLAEYLQETFTKKCLHILALRLNTKRIMDKIYIKEEKRCFEKIIVIESKVLFFKRM